MKNKNNQKKRVCRKDISPLTRVNLSESGTESQKSEPKKYLKFLDPPQNVSAYPLDPKQILDSQSE